MLANGMLAGLVAITAPCAFVNSVSAMIIGVIAGFLVVESVLFFDRVAKIDDPVGAISVHGVNGAWGVLSLGLFADGAYGDGWNGVSGTVKGLLYGDASQFAAQCIGTLTCVVFVFVSFFIFFKIVDALIGNRVSAAVELEGLDVPEMGALAYPDFVLGPGTSARRWHIHDVVSARRSDRAQACSRGCGLRSPAVRPSATAAQRRPRRAMKLIKCIVRPDFVIEATCALEKLGVSGLTVTDVRGRGRRTRPVGDFRGVEYERFLPMSMIDVIAPDDLVDEIVQLVINHTRTGEFGDGRVLVMPIEEGYSIRTRQCGAA